MDCPECGAEMVTFAVPQALRGHAPGEAAAICPSCLSLQAAEDPDPDPEFARIMAEFPGGDAGAATALAVGLLVDSLALHRESVAELFAYAGDRGVDSWLVLERLAVAPTVDPDADIDRLRRQLDQLL